MSYPSVNRHLEDMGVTLENATEEQSRTALLRAFKDDLPLGFSQVENLVKKLKTVDGNRAMISLDPNSDEGKQYARLLGPDIPRRVLSNYFGASFGFYNCCGGVVAPDEDSLQMSTREQIEAQHPNFVDC